MTVTMLKSKIHRATVTQAELDYVGSITNDEALMKASGEEGSGVICLNGAAARCVQKGDKVIIMSYAQIDNTKALEHKPKVVFVDDDNRITRITSYEKHGLLKDMED